MAGPPYVTDDPVPTHTGGWENYVSIAGTQTAGTVAGQSGLDLNYGAAPNLQVSLTLPVDYVSSRGVRAGAGDPVIGAKYRILEPDSGSWLPAAAVFPAVTVPAGSRVFSAGHASLFLPLWLEKDYGPWSIFGGGGYDINPGAGMRNFGLTGLAVTRRIGERLNLGMELYHQTPAGVGEAAVTNLGFGAIYQVTEHWAVMGSGGPGLEAPSRSGSAAFYLSVQFTD